MPVQQEKYISLSGKNNKKGNTCWLREETT
jgi:hypothetical protein